MLWKRTYIEAPDNGMMSDKYPFRYSKSTAADAAQVKKFNHLYPCLQVISSADKSVIIATSRNAFSCFR